MNKFLLLYRGGRVSMFTIISNFLHHWIPIHSVETLPNLVMNFMNTSVNPLGAPMGPPPFTHKSSAFIQKKKINNNASRKQSQYC
jgi:hypothetical protein